MKFKVRDGFVVSYTEVIELTGGKKQEREVTYYPDNGSIELEAARAIQHAHMLEPVDRDAEKFLTRLHVTPNVQDIGGAGVDTQSDAFKQAVTEHLNTLVPGIVAATIQQIQAAAPSGTPAPKV